MHSTISIYDLVVQRLNDQQWLRANRLTQKLVADDSGVPFSTVCKIAQRAIKDPSVHKVQRLYEYFLRVDSAGLSGITTLRNSQNSAQAAVQPIECASGDPRHGDERRRPEQRDAIDRRKEAA